MRREHVVIPGFNEELRATAEIYATADVKPTFVCIEIAADRRLRAARTNVPECIASGHSDSTTWSWQLKLAIVYAVSSCGVRADFFFFPELVRRVDG